MQYFKQECGEDDKLNLGPIGGPAGSYKMGGQASQLGMFGSLGRVGPNASLLQKAGNSQNPMLLKVSAEMLQIPEFIT